MALLTAILAEHAFMKDLEPEYVELIAGRATERHFNPGEYLLKEGDAAEEFFLIRSGRVALGTFISGRGFTTIQSVGDDEIVGWSWLIPPHRWRFSALVIQPTETVCVDGLRLRQTCETDHDFGYQLLKRLSLVLGQRLEETRRRLEI